MKRRSQRCPVVLLVLLWGSLLCAPAPAQAHARFLGSNPAPGASVVDAPTEIEISLSEAVSLDFSTIALLDRTRQELPLGLIEYGTLGETSVSATVGSELPPGTYGVIWRVVSAVDGHLTTGNFVFRVLGAGESPQATPEPVLGATDTTGAGAGDAGPRPSPVQWLVRTLVLVCITFCLGGTIFLVLVVEPAAAEQGRAGEFLWPALGARFARFGAIAAASLVPLLAVDLWAQVAAISETDLGGALGSPDSVSLLLSTTRYGFAWTMKMLAAVVLFGLLLFVWVRRKGGAGLWEVAIAAGSLFLLAETLSSHAAAVQGENVGGLPLPVISDWVHLVTASTWTGGLLFFAIVLFPAYRGMRFEPGARRAFLAAAVPRFSRLALLSVLALGISGTYNLAIQTTDLAAIASSLYGQIVGLKVVLFGLLIALGAINLAHFSPRLRSRGISDGDGTVAGLRRNVWVEVGLIAVVLLCAGGLTLLPPPSADSRASTPGKQAQGGLSPPTPSAFTTSTTTAQVPKPAAAARSIANTSLSLSVLRDSAGETFTLTLSSSGGQAALADVARLALTVSPQGAEAGSTVLRAERVSQAAEKDQVWLAKGQVLAFQGDYLVTVTAQRTSSHDLKAAFWLTFSGEDQLTLNATEYVEARFSTVPEPPVVRRNRVLVELRGSEGQPMAGIALRFGATGPGGAQLPAGAVPMGETAEVGRYEAEVEFSRSGPWTLHVSALRQGQPQLKFSASVDVLPAPVPQP